MKISKKILGVALAVIMIFNVFAVGTFAAFPADASVDLTLTTDKEVYAPGETVTLTFYVQVTEEIGLIQQAGQFEIGYNSAVIKPYSDSIIVEDHNLVSLNGDINGNGMSVVQFTEACVGNGAWLDETCIANYGWTDHINYSMMSGSTLVNTDATAAPVAVFKVDMKIADNAADGTYTIGYNPGGYEGYNAYVNDGIGLGGLYGQVGSDLGLSTEYTYAFGTATFKVSSGPSVVVSHVGEQAKWKGGNANNTAENYLFGFIGQATGLTVETTENNGHQEVTNIQSIVATASYNATTVTSEVITMWAVDGGYQFRAVFSGFDPADTKNVSVTFAITMSDGTTTYVTPDASVDTPNAIYQAAVLRGMPALAA